MKNLFFPFVIFVLMSCSSDADKTPAMQKESTTEENQLKPTGVSRYTWVNESEHLVSLYVQGPSNTPITMDKELVASIAPGESFIKTYRDPVDLVSPEKYFDHLLVLFDDGVYGVFYVLYPTYLPENYDGRYNPRLDENYEFELMPENNGVWTYTFTNADYDTTVSYGLSKPTDTMLHLDGIEVGMGK